MRNKTNHKNSLTYTESEYLRREAFNKAKEALLSSDSVQEYSEKTRKELPALNTSMNKSPLKVHMSSIGKSWSIPKMSCFDLYSTL